ncbi:MAG: dienelactone hydrolase family protein [Candidatus Zixiibacteriota bacterium]|nr:MAG: dienelactone hydrolase family protein [candidate division Zixibacteria bacterium]
MQEILLALVMALLPAAWAQAQPPPEALHQEMVEYRVGDTTMEGYLAYDPGLKGKRPGVLVFHEWMGLDDYARRRADQLARLGYVAFAADIYGKGVRPANREEAAAQAGRFGQDREETRRRGAAALEVLQNREQVDAERIAAIGYCFGGMVALELARSGADLAGVVSFHGSLNTPDPEAAENVKGKVLVLHGSADPSVPPEEVQAFQKAMNEAGVDWYMVAYGHAKHGFTNPNNPRETSGGVEYNEIADRRSWQEMQQFFEEIFALKER